MAKTSTKSLSKLASSLNATPNDVVCFDLRKHETRGVRVRRGKEKMTVTAYEILPGVELDGENPSPDALRIPSALRGVHAGLLYGGEDAFIKQLNIPGSNIPRAKVLESLGLKGENDYRIGYQVLKSASRQSDASLLAVALPEPLAAILPRLLPSGRPVPYAFSVSPVGILNAFLTSSLMQDDLSALLFIDNRECFMAFFNRRRLCLLRRINQGSEALLARIQRNLGVDPETAASMLQGGAIDLSSTIIDIISPILRQFALSRDFVERHESGTLKNVCLCGDPVMAPTVSQGLRDGMRIEPREWDPWESTALLAPLEKPDQKEGWAYSAALGYARAILANTG